MSTPGALAGLSTFDSLNIEYENAYRDNPLKTACVDKAITLLPPHSRRVLDVGCGTGIPVSAMLSDAGLDVVGFDISPKMVELARSRVKGGSFAVSDMLTYTPQGTFSGVLMIFSQLQLAYADLHGAVYKLAQSLESGGILALGQMPGDTCVKNQSRWDETGTYVEDYDAPFMGAMLPTLMLSVQGQRDFLTSMGLEIVSETMGGFQPHNEKCVPERQQYVIARRTSGEPLREPKPLPKGRG